MIYLNVSIKAPAPDLIPSDTNLTGFPDPCMFHLVSKIAPAKNTGEVLRVSFRRQTLLGVFFCDPQVTLMFTHYFSNQYSHINNG